MKVSCHRIFGIGTLVVYYDLVRRCAVLNFGMVVYENFIFLKSYGTLDLELGSERYELGKVIE